MANVALLAAEKRALSTKGALKVLRQDGMVPAIVYGGEELPQMISISYKEVWKYVSKGRFLSTLTKMAIGDHVFHVIARDLQFDPVRDTLVHADFMRVSETQKIVVKVPVHFFNHDLSPGLKRGGALNIVAHELEILCPAFSIPDEIRIDLEGLKIGEVIHINQVTLPEGAVPLSQDKDFTLASLSGASEEESSSGDSAGDSKEDKKK